MTKEREEQTHSLIAVREQLLEEAKGFTLLNDVFMSVALNDVLACQHVLRVLTGISDLMVKEVRTQYSISKITSHSARLDVLAEDTNGKMYNIEIQRSDTVDHARRTRFYGALIDSEFLMKGKDYDELPEVHIIYISETDLWNAGRTVYPVGKYFVGTNIPYEDGIHIVYVNAEIDDASEIATLMRYFKTADPEDNSQGALSKRVQFLKCEEGGRQEMCEVTEKFKMIVKAEQAREIALNLAKMGMTVEKIAQAVEVNTGTVQHWLSEVIPVK